MSEINEHIKNLILLGKRDEAKKELIEQYGLSDDKAEEFVKRYEEANHKKLKPGLAKKLSKGCGCFTIFFLIVFIWGLYTGVSSVLESQDKVNSMVIDFVEEERVDQSTAKTEIYYTPIVEFYYGDRDYIDTLFNEASRSKKYNKGDIIELNVDPDWPEYASNYDIWDAIGDSVVWLVFAVFAFIGYRFLKNFEFKIPITDEMIAAAKMKAMEKDELTDSISEIREEYSTGNENTTDEGDPQENKKEFVTKPSSSPQKKQGGPWVGVIVGLVFTAVGAFLIFSQYKEDQHADRLRSGDKVMGTVVSESRTNSSDNQTTYYYTIEYQYNDQFYSYYTYFTFDDYNRGDKVELMINPDNPEDAAINRVDDLSKEGSYFWGFICFILGATVARFGAKEWIKQIKKKRETREI